MRQSRRTVFQNWSFLLFPFRRHKSLPDEEQVSSATLVELCHRAHSVNCLSDTLPLLASQELDAMFELVDAQARSGAADDD